MSAQPIIPAQTVYVRPTVDGAIVAEDAAKTPRLRVSPRQVSAANAAMTRLAPSASFATRRQTHVQAVSHANAGMIPSVKHVVADPFVCKGAASNVLTTQIAPPAQPVI